jgi:chromosomal replication initiation ATPase DnaA
MNCINLYNSFKKMNEQKEVEVLLKNIQEGLKLYGIKELNEAIIKSLAKKDKKSIVVDYVINIVAEGKEISRRNLIKSNQRSNIQKARQIVYCLLYFELGLTMRQIANIFSKYVRSVSMPIDSFRKLNLNLKTDVDFINDYNIYKEKLKVFINSTVKINQNENIQ